MASFILYNLLTWVILIILLMYLAPKPQLILGLALIALPIVIFVVDSVCAVASGATGDHAAYASFRGVLVAFFTFVPGVILAAVGAFRHWL